MLQFRIQSTPNPMARKYVVNATLKSDGKVSYQAPFECSHVPMAEALLSVPGVSQVHFFANVITVTQDGSMEWAYLDNAVQTIISEQQPGHNADFVDHPERSERQRAPLSPELEVIDAILERTIRPGLQMDGGDIEPLDLEGDILTVRYMGACGGCPSSMSGTLEAIKGILRDEYSPALEVVAI